MTWWTISGLWPHEGEIAFKQDVEKWSITAAPESKHFSSSLLPTKSLLGCKLATVSKATTCHRACNPLCSPLGKDKHSMCFETGVGLQEHTHTHTHTHARPRIHALNLAYTLAVNYLSAHSNADIHTTLPRGITLTYTREDAAIGADGSVHAAERGGWRCQLEERNMRGKSTAASRVSLS